MEKIISDHIEFFHPNRLSSSIVSNVYFDLTMTILAYNLYRLIVREFNMTKSRFERFI